MAKPKPRKATNVTKPTVKAVQAAKAVKTVAPRGVPGKKAISGKPVSRVAAGKSSRSSSPKPAGSSPASRSNPPSRSKSSSPTRLKKPAAKAAGKAPKVSQATRPAKAAVRTRQPGKPAKAAKPASKPVAKALKTSTKRPLESTRKTLRKGPSKPARKADAVPASRKPVKKPAPQPARGSSRSDTRSGKSTLGAKSTPAKGSKTAPAAQPISPAASGKARKLPAATRKTVQLMSKSKSSTSKTGSPSEAVAAVTNSPDSAPAPVKMTPFLKKQRERLLALRDGMLDSMAGVAKDNLRSRAEGSEASAFGLHQADAGSDAYDRDFALSLLSQEQDALYEIEEALKRLDAGTYGVCEMSGKPIPHARLEAIPFARYTVECQSQIEKQHKVSRVRQPVTSLFGLNDDDGGAGGDNDDDDSGSDMKE